MEGLSLVVDAFKLLYNLCEQVSIKRDATRLISYRCEHLVERAKTLRSESADDLQPAFDLIKSCLTKVKDRVEKWAHLRKRDLIKMIPHLWEIDRNIQLCHADIADCSFHFQMIAFSVLNRSQGRLEAGQSQILAELRQVHDGRPLETVMAEANNNDINDIIQHLCSGQSTEELLNEVSRLDREKILGQAAMLRDIMGFVQQIIRNLKDSKSSQFVSLSNTLYEIQARFNILPPNLHLTSAEVEIKESLDDLEPPIEVLCGTYLKREEVTVKVVVDTLNPKTHELAKKRFLREGQIWEQVYHLDHGKYILPFYGFGELSAPYKCLYMVSPRLEMNILQYVQDQETRGLTVNYGQLIKDIAEGLRVLHSFLSPPVVHGDLRCANIFIKDGNPLIGDFGLSRMVEDATKGAAFSHNPTSLNERGRWWYPPEMYKSEIYTASDIYLFGSTVLELMTHKPPFDDEGEDRGHHRIPVRPQQGEVVKRGLDDSLWELLERCWKEVPSDRPPIGEVLKTLTDLFVTRRS